MALSSGKDKDIKKLGLLDYEGPWDSWVRLIVGRKYETYRELMKYDIEDYIHLFEFVLIEWINETIINSSMMKK